MNIPELKERLLERLLRYAAFDTRSDPESETYPSTARQLLLLNHLVEELTLIGLDDVEIDEYGYVTATVPSTLPEEDSLSPTVGFIAHVDTSPDMSGEGVRPQVVRDYDGGAVPLGDGGLVLSPEDFPELALLRGHTLVTTDGTTLLGADDKAGVAEIMTLARMCGAIDAPLTDENLPECGLILIAIRPGAAVEWVRAHGAQISKNAIVVDLCGVKRVVVEAITPLAEQYGFAYIGGHPMAGRERGGFTASSEDLYMGASMILTPDKRTDMKLLETLQAFFLDLGFAGLTFSQPEEHDRIIAFTSQLAHIVSSAYVKSPEAQRRRGFSAGSFQDMTRVARLDEDMWTELFLDDSDYLIKELDILIQNLADYADALKARDAERVRTLLKEGRELKASAGGN